MKEDILFQVIVCGVIFVGVYMYLANRDILQLKCVMAVMKYT